MIALLAVEQLTGAVVAAQAKLGSSGTADAGAQAGAVLAAFKEAQGTVDQLIAEEVRLHEQMSTLAEQRRLATDPAQQAALDAQITKTDAALARISAQIVAQTKVVEALAVPLGEAAKQTIKTAATATADLSGGSGSNQTIPPHVSEAVTEITKAALLQDYSGQICAEALRARDIEGPSDPLRPKLAQVGSVFLGFCKTLFKQLVDDRRDLTASVIKLREADAHTRLMVADAVQSAARKLPKEMTAEQLGQLVQLMAIAVGTIDDASVTPPSVAVRNIVPPG